MNLKQNQVAIAKPDQDPEIVLYDDIASFHDNPLGFVLYVFPWGEGDLKDEEGPDEWQTWVLTTITKEIKKRKGGDVLNTAIQIAVASGHGIGKSALIAWIIMWFISTRAFPQIVVTAGTFSQLTTKTWRELSVWHKRSIHQHWFQWTATKFYQVDNPEDWFAAAVPWSEHNADAFAGTHAKDVLILFDEASAIAKGIWETVSGALTTAGAMWIAFGNPTKNTGSFKECFTRMRHRWITKQVDSRTAKMANKVQLDQWIEDYGLDSDYVRVRVLGQFPKQASTQFISEMTADHCMKTYKAAGYESAPIAIGCDPARFGDDQTVILVRQGRKELEKQKFRGIDTVAIAEHVAHTADHYNTDNIFVDGVGIGAGVVDNLRAWGYRVTDVQSGTTADDDLHYSNKRAEMWDRMKQMLNSGFELLEDQEMYNELTSIEYSYRNNKLVLEKVEDLKARGYSSPDNATALALTLAFPVRSKSPTGRVTRSSRDEGLVTMNKQRILRKGGLKNNGRR